jgi:cellulose synthase/poly-beta-1,6-N-acetylglucosamine synthase-like glycosyltransferase
MKFSRVLLLVAIYLALLLGIWVIFAGVPLWEGFIHYIARIAKAVFHSQVAVHDVGIMPLFPIFVALEIFLSYVPILCTRRNYTRYPKDRPISLIIPCHHSENLLASTLREALKVFQPAEIYVIDNGNSPQPQDATRKVCDELGVNYFWCPVGSKAAAIYIGAKLATTEFVMQIDDDQHIDPEVNFPITETTGCIGYTITAQSHTEAPTNLIQQFQDIEYKASGITKSFEAMLGTTQFAHGAMSLWRREALLECLASHPAFPISDDWFLGFTASQLGYTVKMCNSHFHSTDVPRTLFNMSKLKCCTRSERKSGYGSATLWNQRFSRWYRLTVLQFVYVLWAIFTSWKLPLRQALVLKCSQCWMLLSILFTNLKYILIVIYFLVDPALGGIFLALILGLFVLRLLVLNFWQLRGDERMGVLPLLLFQFYKLYDNVVFGLALLWSLLFTAPLALASERTSYATDPRLAKILEDFQAGSAITNIRVGPALV